MDIFLYVRNLSVILMLFTFIWWGISLPMGLLLAGAGASLKFSRGIKLIGYYIITSVIALYSLSYAHYSGKGTGLFILGGLILFVSLTSGIAKIKNYALEIHDKTLYDFVTKEMLLVIC